MLFATVVNIFLKMKDFLLLTFSFFLYIIFQWHSYTNTLLSVKCVSVSKCYLLSCVQLFATLWTIAHQATQSMEFSMQEYWCGQPYPF